MWALSFPTVGGIQLMPSAVEARSKLLDSQGIPYIQYPVITLSTMEKNLKINRYTYIWIILLYS